MEINGFNSYNDTNEKIRYEWLTNRNRNCRNVKNATIKMESIKRLSFIASVHPIGFKNLALEN